MTPTEFYDLCAAHDWHYQFSEDPGVWTKGVAESNKLVAFAAASLEFNQIYTDWAEHALKKKPKPARPA